MLALRFLAFFLVVSNALAQADYPVRPVRLITPFNPGGAIDIYSRTIAAYAQRLGQNQGQ